MCSFFQFERFKRILSSPRSVSNAKRTEMFIRYLNQEQRQSSDKKCWKQIQIQTHWNCTVRFPVHGNILYVLEGEAPSAV